MASFEGFISKINDIVQVTANKSKQITETTKYTVSILSEENNIKKLYADLGKLYFEEFGMSAPEPFSAICEKIIQAKRNIIIQKDKIDEVKSREANNYHGDVPKDFRNTAALAEDAGNMNDTGANAARGGTQRTDSSSVKTEGI